ncbi:MAG: head-tail joining protein [Janthinobacterium lividum]
MPDPFTTALAAQFASPMAVAAVYIPANDAPIPLRVIRSQASADAVPGFGGGRIIHDSDTIDVQLSDVAEPALGDLVTIVTKAGTKTYKVNEDPMLDTEGLSWRFAIIVVPD